MCAPVFMCVCMCVYLHGTCFHYHHLNEFRYSKYASAVRKPNGLCKCSNWKGGRTWTLKLKLKMHRWKLTVFFWCPLSLSLSLSLSSYVFFHLFFFFLQSHHLSKFLIKLRFTRFTSNKSITIWCWSIWNTQRIQNEHISDFA